MFKFHAANTLPSPRTSNLTHVTPNGAHRGTGRKFVSACKPQWTVLSVLRRMTSANGFSLLETMLAILLSSVFIAATVPSFLHLTQFFRVIGTRQSLLWDLRYAQSIGESLGHYGEVRMAPYSPYYSVYSGAEFLQTIRFMPGVNYTEGALHLPNAYVHYDDEGNSVTGGTIRLQSGERELDINLYQDAGLQTALDLLP